MLTVGSDVGVSGTFDGGAVFFAGGAPLFGTPVLIPNSCGLGVWCSSPDCGVWNSLRAVYYFTLSSGADSVAVGAVGDGVITVFWCVSFGVIQSVPLVAIGSVYVMNN